MKRNIYNIILTGCLLFGLLASCIEDADVPVDVVTNAAVPELSLLELKGKTATTVTIEGEVAKANGYAITERGIIWGTSEPLDIGRDSHKSLTDNSNTILLTADNLKAATTYYFRLYAKNRAGTGYSDTKPFVTNDGLGIVRTIIIGEATKAKTAKAGGVIENTGEGPIQERGVYYSPNADLANKDSIVYIEAKDSFVCDLTGLTPSTKYYVQAYVKNQHGIFKGKIENFTTGSGLPVLSNELIVKPESNKAHVQGEVLSIGDTALLIRGFCWSKTSTPNINNDTVLVAITEKDGLGAMAKDIQPLEPSTEYYVWAFAKNEYGESFSLPKIFKTTSDMPTVETLDAKTILDNRTVIFGGRVIDVGASDVEKIGICYAISPKTPTISDTNVEIPISPIKKEDVPYPFYTNEISGLKGSTTYNIRAYAINENNRVQYGDMKTLQTPPIFTMEPEFFPGVGLVEGSSTSFVIGDRGFIVGGDNGTNLISNLYCYNPAPALSFDYRWGELTGYPGGRIKYQSVAVFDNTRAYLLGGQGIGAEAKNDFYLYGLDNVWSSKSKGPDSAFLRAGFSINNEAVYVGGMRDTANNEVWAYNIYADTWSKKADFPVNHYGGIAVNIDHTAYVGLGKNTAGVGYKQLWKSDGTLSTWTPEPSNTNLNGNVLAGVVFNDKIYIIERLPSGDRYFIHEYDPAYRVWKRKSQLPYYSWSIQFMFAIRGRIYIGFANTDKVVSYDPSWDN